jgi:hypothetical protein
MLITTYYIPKGSSPLELLILEYGVRLDAVSVTASIVVWRTVVQNQNLFSDKYEAAAFFLNFLIQFHACFS